MQINFITRSKSANLDPSIQIFITKLYYLNQKNAYFQRVQIRGVQIRVRIEGGSMSGQNWALTGQILG